MATELSREREGLQLAKCFMDYCFGIGEKMELPRSVAIQEACNNYADKLCDGCGGAMNCEPCPVHKYREEPGNFIDGKKTMFSRDFSKIRIDSEC